MLNLNTCADIVKVILDRPRQSTGASQNDAANPVHSTYTQNGPHIRSFMEPEKSGDA